MPETSTPGQSTARTRGEDPAAVQQATDGMTGRDIIADHLADGIPWLGPDAALTVAGMALLALRDAGLVVVEADAVEDALLLLKGRESDVEARLHAHLIPAESYQEAPDA